MGGEGPSSVQSAESPLILILCQFIVEIFWHKYVETLFTKKEHFSFPCICANFVLVIIPVPSLVTNINKDIFRYRSFSNLFIYEK